MIAPGDYVDTKTAAALLHRSPQRLREWATNARGFVPPIRPIRLSGFGSRLLWSRAEIEALLSGEPRAERAGEK
jgi:hypothetical protein